MQDLLLVNLLCHVLFSVTAGAMVNCTVDSCSKCKMFAVFDNYAGHVTVYKWKRLCLQVFTVSSLFLFIGDVKPNYNHIYDFVNNMVNLPYCLQILERYLFNMIAIEILNEISEKVRRQAIFSNRPK